MPVTDLAKASELFDVDMNQVFGTLPLAALHWRCGFQILQPPQPQPVEHPGHAGEGSGQPPSSGDVNQPINQPLNQPSGLLVSLSNAKNPCQNWAGRELGEEAG